MNWKDILKVCIGLPIAAFCILRFDLFCYGVWIAAGLCMAYGIGDFLWKKVNELCA